MRRYKALVLYAAVVIGLSVAWRVASINHDDVLRSLASIEGRVAAHFAETAILFGAASAFLAYVSFPGMPLVYVAAGYCLGARYGGVSMLLGSTCGHFGVFLLYRRYIPERLRQPRAASRPVKAWMTLLGLRLSPVIPAPIVNGFAVLFEASIAQFLTTTILGSAPLILLYESMGHQGRGLLRGVQMDWRQIASYAAILLISTLLSLLGPWRSLFATVRNLKVGAFAAMARKASAEPATAAAVVSRGE